MAPAEDGGDCGGRLLWATIQRFVRTTPATLSFDNLKKPWQDTFRQSKGGLQKPMVAGRTDVLQGTLELLVLRALAIEPMHGWGMAQRTEQMSGGVFAIQQGTLYPALQRLKRKGWVRSDWHVTENNRRARYYSLTDAGCGQLDREREAWERTVNAVNGVLNWAGGTE